MKEARITDALKQANISAHSITYYHCKFGFHITFGKFMQTNFTFSLQVGKLLAKPADEKYALKQIADMPPKGYG